MPKKPDEIRRAINELRRREAPSIDGSYVCLSAKPLPEYAKAAHPPYTPEQIEAERKALGRGIAAHVYFIRDERLPAPYWVSPFRQAVRSVLVEGKDGDPKSVRVPYIVFNVAQSREARKGLSVEVAIPLPQLAAMKEKGGPFILSQLRSAIANVVPPKIHIAAA